MSDYDPSDDLKQSFARLSKEILTTINVPSRQRSLALTHLEQAELWVLRAIEADRTDV